MSHNVIWLRKKLMSFSFLDVSGSLIVNDRFGVRVRSCLSTGVSESSHLSLSSLMLVWYPLSLDLDFSIEFIYG